MGIKNYNDSEAKYSSIISQLKSLPQIKAPADFELKLMIKIRNNELDYQKYKDRQFSLIKFFAPTAAIIIVSAVLFFVLITPQPEAENPLMIEPKLIENNIQNNSQVASVGQSKIKGNNTYTNKTILPPQSSKCPFVVKPNDVVVSVEKNNVPLNSDKTINLDEYISGQAKSEKTITGGNLVSSENDNYDFGGFFVREEPDPKVLQKYRAMIDSINLAKKVNSLRKKDNNLKER
ncbi:hypothetical protein ABRY23_05510 [Melioribacteraceae bacterium 4301-Me]|uniref:hypothetical protein n=1 Tax=Pyranulibacter aquaticus TaxID=3163344 RepID=UPI003596D785